MAGFQEPEALPAEVSRPETGMGVGRTEKSK